MRAFTKGGFADLAQVHAWNQEFVAASPVGLTYEVIASGGGTQLFRQTFEPAVIERPFFDRFPDYEHVRVTTGWIKADVAGRTAIDERIATDPERFWDHFQSRTLPALYGLSASIAAVDRTHAQELQLGFAGREEVLVPRLDGARSAGHPCTATP